MKKWMIICAVLVALAFVFYFFFKGYTYISYTLLFISALIFIHYKAPLPLRRITAVFTCIGLVYFCIVEAFIISNSFTDRDPGRDYLIVLGAAVHGDIPSLSLQHRLESALEYLETFPESKAVVSGGKGNGENISEAQCMYDWLIRRGIDGSRIIMDPRSTSTMENLSFSRELILSDGGTMDNVAILSSSYHLYRAKLMARSLGFDPAGVRARRGYPVYTAGMYIREAFGVTHLRVFGS